MKLLLSILFVPSVLLAVDFDREIRPLLQERCIECHGDKKQKGELRLDAKVHAFKGGHDGPAILAGKADASPLFLRVTSTDEDERMPPKGDPLTSAQISLIREWIKQIYESLGFLQGPKLLFVEGSKFRFVLEAQAVRNSRETESASKNWLR